MRHRWGGLLLAALISLSASAQDVRVADERKLKLAYLFNFMQFVDWPPAQLAADGPIRLCVVGDNPFGDDLQALAQRLVRGRPLTVDRPTRLDDIRACHLVYLERLNAPGVPPRLLEALREVPVLLVAGERGALAKGAMIEFAQQGARLRWHLNLEQARQAGLRLSAKLVELSLPPPDGGGA